MCRVRGKVKFLESETFDFSQAVGGPGYRLNEHFDFLLATDKNFLGDGYRSLLLSDNAYSYPFFVPKCLLEIPLCRLLYRLAEYAGTARRQFGILSKVRYHPLPECQCRSEESFEPEFV